jgi:hypothetical protein
MKTIISNSIRVVSYGTNSSQDLLFARELSAHKIQIHLANGQVMGIMQIFAHLS